MPFKKNILCIGAGYVGGPTMTMIARKCPEYKIMVVHDFAYTDLTFDGYRAPSFLSVPGAKDVGVEIISLSKSYSMAGWRVGCAAGNAQMIEALRRTS